MCGTLAKSMLVGGCRSVDDTTVVRVMLERLGESVGGAVATPERDRGGHC